MKQLSLRIIMVSLVILPSFAQEEDPFFDEALFGTEEDLFGDESGVDDLLTVEENAETEATGAAELLTTANTRIGGNFSFSIGSNFPVRDESSTDDLTSNASLDASLFLDARPSEDFRFFLSCDLAYPFANESGDEPSFIITEVFSDIILGDLLYTRTGKQTLNWGVGYFYSPADIVSLGTIDPTDPEAQLEGPVALKLQLPLRSTNLYLITIAEDLFDGGSPAFAPKLEFVLGETEISLGGFYQYAEPWAAMGTVTTAFWDLDFFAEAVLQYGNTNKILQYNDMLLKAVDTPDTWYQHYTAGISYSTKDDDGLFDFFTAGQYYYNGQGYNDPDILQEPSLAILLVNEEISAGDLVNPGQHYLGASFRWNKLLGSDFTLSEFLQWNLTDGSIFLDNKISYTGLDHLDITLGYRQSFGEEDRQFTTVLSDPRIYIEIQVGAGEF
jgi:hypothetical protein